MRKKKDILKSIQATCANSSNWGKSFTLVLEYGVKVEFTPKHDMLVLGRVVEADCPPEQLEWCLCSVEDFAQLAYTTCQEASYDDPMTGMY